MSLHDWVAQARAGDPRAFERLVAHYQAQMYHLAYHHLGNGDDAMDACQDAALDAWRSVRRFQGDADAFRRWLIRIVVNASLDRSRHEARRPHAPIEVERDGCTYALPLPDPGQTPEEYAENGDLGELLESCLAQLTLEHRTVILLDQLGMSYPEMAEVTDAEVGTVKSRLSRARARMRDLLTADHAWPTEPQGPHPRLRAEAPGGSPEHQDRPDRRTGTDQLGRHAGRS